MNLYPGVCLRHELTLDSRRAIEEPGMQLHFLPLHEANRHLALRGCTVLSTKPCDDHVAVPGRASTAHCIVFTRSAT
jgi:hypothetical protein